MDSEEYPSNGSRDALQKVLFSRSKLPLITVQLRPKLCRLYCMRVECEVWSFGKFHAIVVDIQSKRYFVHQSVKCPYLSIARNQTYNVCSA
jgi:hypothetical protein